MTTIAVASDLHADARGTAESFLTEGASRAAWKAHPIGALCRLIEREDLSAEYLVSPGDFANRCSLPGLRIGWEAVTELAEALGATVIGSLGNHDVDSHLTHGDPDVFIHARNVSPLFPLGEIAANVAYWRKGYVLINRPDVAFLVFNSSLHHAIPDEIKHGKITHELLDPLEEELESTDLPELRIAIVHHHPHLHEELGLGAADVMYGGQELLTLLGRFGFQLVVHGHKHHPKLSYAAGGPTAPVIFAAGSLTFINYAELAANTRNLFHLVTVEPSTAADRTVHGSIKSWEFNCGIGWNPATFRSAGFPYYAGFGCRQTPAQLAADTAAVVRRRIGWAEVLQLVPCLPYALPSMRNETLSQLRTHYDVRTLHDDLGEPVELAPNAV